jgi:hypothetical protein
MTPPPWYLANTFEKVMLCHWYCVIVVVCAYLPVHFTKTAVNYFLSKHTSFHHDSTEQVGKCMLSTTTLVLSPEFDLCERPGRL